jgi:hypothetical protein
MNQTILSFILNYSSICFSFTANFVPLKRFMTPRNQIANCRFWPQILQRVFLSGSRADHVIGSQFCFCQTAFPGLGNDCKIVDELFYRLVVWWNQLHSEVALRRKSSPRILPEQPPSPIAASRAAIFRALWIDVERLVCHWPAATRARMVLRRCFHSQTTAPIPIRCAIRRGGRRRTTIATIATTTRRRIMWSRCVRCSLGYSRYSDSIRFTILVSLRRLSWTIWVFWRFRLSLGSLSIRWMRRKWWQRMRRCLGSQWVKGRRCWCIWRWLQSP